MSRRKQLVLAWLPAILYMAAIWIVSSIQVQAPFVREFPLRDKGVHFVEFALLGFLIGHAALRTWPHKGAFRAVAVGALIAMGWGLLDELHQSLVPGRTAELLDFVADVLGATAGAAAQLAWWRVRGGTSQARRAASTGDES